MGGGGGNLKLRQIASKLTTANINIIEKRHQALNKVVILHQQNTKNQRPSDVSRQFHLGRGASGESDQPKASDL